MLINDQVIGQGVVLTSILTGFAFAIAAQVSLQVEHHARFLESAGKLYVSGISSLTAAIVGFFFFANDGDVGTQFILAMTFFVLLLIGIFLFIIGLVEIVINGLTRKKRWPYIFITTCFSLIIVASFLIGYL